MRERSQKKSAYMKTTDTIMPAIGCKILRHSTNHLSVLERTVCQRTVCQLCSDPPTELSLLCPEVLAEHAEKRGAAT
jgi:hypothetical protein